MPRRILWWMVWAAIATGTASCAEDGRATSEPAMASPHGASSARPSQEAEPSATSAPTRADGQVVAAGKPTRLSTFGIVGAGGPNTASAYAFLDSPSFDDLSRKVSAEGARSASAVEATYGLQQTLSNLAAAIDPQAQLGQVACNEEVCVTSIQSRMDQAQWETWKSEFAKTGTPKRSATIYSPRKLADGSSQVRVMLVTKAGSSGVAIPFNSIPTAEDLRRASQRQPPG